MAVIIAESRDLSGRVLWLIFDKSTKQASFSATVVPHHANSDGFIAHICLVFWITTFVTSLDHFNLWTIGYLAN